MSDKMAGNKRKNYTPKYSLSIKILSMMMSKRELNKLIKEYVITKKANWGKYGKK